MRAGGNHVIDDFWWVSDTRVVATVAEQLGGVDRPQPNGELYAIDADGSNGRMLFGYRGKDGVGSHLKRVEKRFAGVASYGGYAALSGVEREPDLYRCAIGYVGVYDLPMMYSRGDVPRSLYGTEYLDMVLGGNTQELRTRSPVAAADRIKAAVMLVAGGRDERVPIAQARAMRDALDEHHHPYEWLVKDSEGHGFYDTANQVEFYTRLAAFLDAHIGARAGAAPSAP